VPYSLPLVSNARLTNGVEHNHTNGEFTLDGSLLRTPARSPSRFAGHSLPAAHRDLALESNGQYAASSYSSRTSHLSNDRQDFDIPPRIGYLQAFKDFVRNCVYDNDWVRTFGKLDDQELISNINGLKEELDFGIHILDEIGATRSNLQDGYHRLNKTAQLADEYETDLLGRSPNRLNALRHVSTKHRVQQLGMLEQQKKAQNTKFQYLNALTKSFQLRFQADFEEVKINNADVLSEAVPSRFKNRVILGIEYVQEDMRRLAQTVLLGRRVFNGLGICALICPIPFSVPLLAGEKIYHSLSVGQVLTTCIQAIGRMIQRPTADHASWRLFAFRRGFISNINTAIFIPTTVLPFVLKKAGLKHAANTIHHWGFKYSIPAGGILVVALLATEFKWFSKIKEKWVEWQHGKEDFSALRRQVKTAHAPNHTKDDAEKLCEIYHFAQSYAAELMDIRDDFIEDGAKKISDLVDAQITQILDGLVQLMADIDQALPINQPDRMIDFVLSAEESALDYHAKQVQNRSHKMRTSSMQAQTDVGQIGLSYGHMSIRLDLPLNHQDEHTPIDASENREDSYRSMIAGTVRAGFQAIGDVPGKIKSLGAPDGDFETNISPEEAQKIVEVRPVVEAWLDQNRNTYQTQKLIDKDRAAKLAVSAASIFIAGLAVYSILPDKIGAVDLGADAVGVTCMFLNKALNPNTTKQYLIDMMKDFNGLSTIMPPLLIPNKGLKFIQDSTGGYFGSMAYFAVMSSGFVGPMTELLGNLLDTTIQDVGNLINRFKHSNRHSSDQVLQRAL
jgi:hypothetical protein